MKKDHVLLEALMARDDLSPPDFVKTYLIDRANHRGRLTALGGAPRLRSGEDEREVIEEFADALKHHENRLRPTRKPLHPTATAYQLKKAAQAHRGAEMRAMAQARVAALDEVAVGQRGRLIGKQRDAAVYLGTLDAAEADAMALSALKSLLEEEVEYLRWYQAR